MRRRGRQTPAFALKGRKPDGNGVISRSARSEILETAPGHRRPSRQRSTIALAVDAVALAATIGGSVVAFAGVGATAWSASVQRRSARELAESRHEHELRLARGARLFERRG